MGEAGAERSRLEADLKYAVRALQELQAAAGGGPRDHEEDHEESPVGPRGTGGHGGGDAAALAAEVAALQEANGSLRRAHAAEVAALQARVGGYTVGIPQSGVGEERALQLRLKTLADENAALAAEVPLQSHVLLS